jgi:hypothetical protein
MAYTCIKNCVGSRFFELRGTYSLNKRESDYLIPESGSLDFDHRVFLVALLERYQKRLDALKKSYPRQVGAAAPPIEVVKEREQIEFAIPKIVEALKREE